MEYKKKKMNDLAKIWSESLLPKWTDIKDKKTIKHYFYEGLPDNLRGKIWMLCLGNSFSITLDYYNIEVKKAIEIFLKNSSKDTKLNQSTDIETSLKISLPSLAARAAVSPTPPWAAAMI